MKTVTVFGGSAAREGETDYETARVLGTRLARSGYAVCNGGYGGVMEAAARGAREAGGRTIGVTAEEFGGPVNSWIEKEIRMKSWKDRLFKLIELGDAFIIMDGGTGTLAEFFVVWEMSNKQMFRKPVLILGSHFKRLVERVRQIPQVVDNPALLFSETVDEALKVLETCHAGR